MKKENGICWDEHFATVVKNRNDFLNIFMVVNILAEEKVDFQFLIKRLFLNTLYS